MKDNLPFPDLYSKRFYLHYGVDSNQYEWAGHELGNLMRLSLENIESRKRIIRVREEAQLFPDLNVFAMPQGFIRLGTQDTKEPDITLISNSRPNLAELAFNWALPVDASHIIIRERPTR